MKKILFLFIAIVMLSLIDFKIKTVSLEKIDLKLGSDDIAITFLNEDDNKILLISDLNYNLIVLLEGQNLSNLSKIVNLFSIDKIDFILSNDTKINSNVPIKSINYFKYEDILVMKENEIIIIKLKNYNFCICDSNNNELNNCDFVYFLKEDNYLNLSKNIDLVFVDELINDSFVQKIYEKWIDYYKINKNEFLTLKLSDDRYNVIVFPK